MAKILGEQITNYTISTEQLSNTAVVSFTKSLAPKIRYANVASNTYVISNDTVINTDGGYIVITGAEFQSGAQVLIDTTPASSVTYVDNTTLRAQVPAKSASSYNLYVVNPDGGIGIKPAGITYSAPPTWVTTSPLANVQSNTAFSNTFSATLATSYANTTILPTGFNLLSNGYYYGNISVGATTTYNFDIRATDAELQDSDKTFSLTAVAGPTYPYTLEYLVVAGGGAGGGGGPPSDAYGGGGGAGGLLTGNTSISSAGITYTITVGAGGAAKSQGGTSVFYYAPNPATLNIPTTGGGAGGGQGGSPVTSYNGQPGGSGGGGGVHSGAAATGSGTPGQGNPGGSNNQPANYGAGGGGGKGSAGGPGSPSSSGGGGFGYTWPFTANTYAGGGAGNPNPYGAIGDSNASGSPGGGGPGTSSPGNGTPGKGGGGGGNATGGSGAVILAIPTPFYPGSAPGATVTTPPAAPGRTVLTFNSSGTFTT